MAHVLKVENLHVEVEGKAILRGVNLEMHHGQTHALMGPNGSGKSTLGLVIAGHPGYQVTAGSITLDGEDVLEMEADQRSRAEIFMAFQRPVAIQASRWPTSFATQQPMFVIQTARKVKT